MAGVGVGVVWGGVEWVGCSEKQGLGRNSWREAVWMGWSGWGRVEWLGWCGDELVGWAGRDRWAVGDGGVGGGGSDELKLDLKGGLGLWRS